MTTPKSLHAQNLKGIQYIQTHDYQKAADMFESVLKTDPDNIGAHAGIVALLYGTGNERAAYTHAQKVLKKGSNHIPLLEIVINITIKLGKFDDAKHFATKAYNLAPNSVQNMRAYLCYLQYTDKRHEIEQIAQSLLAQSKDAFTHLIAGTALERTGKIIEAICIYRNIITDTLGKPHPPPVQR